MNRTKKHERKNNYTLDFKIEKISSLKETVKNVKMQATVQDKIPAQYFKKLLKSRI